VIDRHFKLVKDFSSWLQSTHPEWVELLSFESPPSLNEGPSYDLAIPCFPLAKALRKAPPQIAQEFATEVRASQLPLEQVDAIGSYVNIRFSTPALADALSSRFRDPLIDSAKALAGQKVLIEYSSPNIAKPFGIGHLRSTNIGAAICRIYQALGADLTKINHLGDWGTGFGALITAYKRFGSADFVKGDPVNNLYKLYVEFHQKEKDDPALLDEAREWFSKLEKGDEEAKELWTWFRDVSYHEFKKIYEKLGVSFDYVTGESFYSDLMRQTLQRLEEKNLLKESEGAMVVDLEAYGMPPCLIKKTDGSSLYATRDLAAAEYRMDTFNPSKMIYVVGGEQKLHFKQVYKVLELMGYAWAKDNWAHVDFGLIKFPDGKMSTRKGNLVLLEEVLHQAEKEAYKVMEEKGHHSEDPDFTEEKKREISNLVGTGAVIFFDLKAKRTKDVHFDWKEILNFEGDSGPYLQYSGVRMGAILQKAKESGVTWSKKDIPALSTESERQLALQIISLPAAVEAAARDYEPSMISNHLLDLAGAFNRFYMNVKILKGEEDLRAGRLALVEMTKNALVRGLGLLGISCPERM
jgi:arginyl-tRNA synthetase